MKKFYTLLSVFALASTGAFAQSAMKAELATTEAIPTSKKATSTPFKGGAVWTNNFDNPSDWTVEADDSTHGWLITSSSRSWYSGSIKSTSGGNYALFRNGDPRVASGPNAPVKGGKEWNITTAQPINLSSLPFAAINYQVFGARFVDDLEVQYSTDGTTWQVADKLSSNVRTLSSTQPVNDLTNPTNRTAIMPGAGGSATVWIRVHWVNSSVSQPGNDGIAYGFSVDDFSITEAPARELQVYETFPGTDSAGANFFYYQEIPLEQATMLTPRIAYTNKGAKPQIVTATVEVLKDGAPFGTYTASSGTPVGSVESDTITVQTFVPTAEGTYTFNFSIAGDSKTNGVDDVETESSDNDGLETIYITKGIWSDDKGGREWDGNGYYAFRTNGGPAPATPYASVTAGQSFEVKNNGSRAYGITTVLFNGPTQKTSVGSSLFIELFKFNNPETDYNSGFSASNMQSVAQTEYIIQAADTFLAGTDETKYTYIRFDDAVDLTPGLYIATVASFGGTSAYNIPMYSDDNRDGSGVLRGNIQQGVGSESTYSIYANVSPFIKLNLNADVRVAENKANKFELAQNQPNPASSTSIIAYSLKEAGKASLTIVDITGKTVVSENFGTKTAGNYTYSVNAGNFNAGIYFYTLTVDGQSITKKMVISE